MSAEDETEVKILSFFDSLVGPDIDLRKFRPPLRAYNEEFFL